MDFPMPGKGQCALMVIKEAKSMKRVTIREGFGAGVYPMDHNPVLHQGTVVNFLLELHNM